MKKLVITLTVAFCSLLAAAQVEVIESDSKSTFDGNSYEVISDLSLLNGFRVNRTNDGEIFARIKEFTTYPADGELVGKNSNIELIFNDIMDNSNIHNEITITGSSSGSINYSWGINRRRIIINPDNDFLDNEIITVQISDQLTGTYGRWNPQNISFQFTIDRHTAIPDTNFEQVLIDLGYDDELDGYARTSFVETISDLDISNKSINLLNGIEAMTALRTLNAYNNSIGSADLVNNVLLENFNLSRNQLTNLILPNSSNLSFLDASSNSLTTLDLSSSLALTDVDIRTNALECVQIDASQESASASWAKDRFSFFTTDCINISYTYIPDDDFERYLINGGYDLIQDDYIPTEVANDITSLWIRNSSLYNCYDTDLNSFPCNYNVTDLTGIQDFVNLSSLRMTNADLALADFTNNINLRLINLIGPSLAVADLSNSTLLETVIIESNQVNLSLNLPTSGTLKRIDLNHTNTNSLDLSSEVALEFVDVSYGNLTELTLLNNPNLHTLNAKECRSLQILQIPNSLGITDLDIRGCYELACVEVDPSLIGNIPVSWETQPGVYFSDDCTSRTYVPDDAFEQFLILLDLDDKLDDYVFNSRIENVEELNLGNRYSLSILDLTGIEGFTSLKHLTLVNDDISLLDLSANLSLETLSLTNTNTSSINLTGLVDLVEINIKDNPLSSLDLTGLSSIEELRLENNLLTSLDLADSPNLEYLLAPRNRLSSINVSSNPLLRFLIISVNELTSLDVSMNPSLTNLSVGGNLPLSCITVNSSQLANIPSSWNKAIYTAYSEDCSRRTFIPDDNFEQALIDEGYDNILDDYIITDVAQTIESLDFLNDKGISSLDGIQDFTSLKYLNASNNLLTSVDLSSNVMLETLLIGYNSLSTIDLTNNTLLETIDLSSNDFSVINLDYLTQLKALWLNNNTNLSILNVNAFSDLVGLGIANTSISEIDVSTNYLLTSLNVKELPNLDHIDVSNNTFLSIFELSEGSNFACIQVNNDQLNNTPVGWQITDGIDNKSFISLLCEKTVFNDSNFEQEIINTGWDQKLDGFAWKEHMPNITFLNIHNKGIADATGIEDLVGLETFWAGGNSFTSLNLSNSPNLETLIIQDNLPLTSLAVNSSNLKLLDADNTSITSIDVSFAAGLEILELRNVPITNLDLSSNTLLERLFLNNTPLTSLNLKPNTEIRYFDSSNSSLGCVEVNSQQQSCAKNGCSGWYWQYDLSTTFTSNCDLVFIPDDNFEQLLIDYNFDDVLDDYVLAGNIDGLTGLGLDGNQYPISDFTGIENFVSVENLSITNQDLSPGIDLSSLNNLRLFTGTNSQISNLTNIQFSDPSKIEKLSLNDNNLGNVNLNSFLNLEELQIVNSGINSIDISNNSMLRILNCGNNNLVNIDLTANSNLEHLTCYQNSLSNIDLTNNTLLKEIYVYLNNLSSLDISNNPLLEIVFAGGSLFEPSPISSIDLANNPELRTIDLGFASLNAINTSANSKLENLRVRENQISSIDLANNPNLTTLSLHNNNISSIDLMNNFNLSGIDVRGNMLSNIEVGHLSDLTSLWVNDNSLTDLDVNNNLSLNFLGTSQNTGLSCIQVNATQLASIPQYWQKGDDQIYSLDCSSPPAPDIAPPSEEIVLSNEDANIDLTLYPNPTDDVLYLKSLSLMESSIGIYDLNGKAVYNLDYSDSFEHNINTSKIPSGIYILKVESKDGFTTERKIVIRH